MASENLSLSPLDRKFGDVFFSRGAGECGIGVHLVEELGELMASEFPLKGASHGFMVFLEVRSRSLSWARMPLRQATLYERLERVWRQARPARRLLRSPRVITAAAR